MHFKKIGFIGGGRVTAFLLSRLKKNDGLPEEVIVSDPNSERHHAISQIDPRKIHCTTENTEPARTEVVFFAVHPPVVPEVCTEIKSALARETFLVSLIPTIPLVRLTELLDGFDCIVRMIPTHLPSLEKGIIQWFIRPSFRLKKRKNFNFFLRIGASPLKFQSPISKRMPFSLVWNQRISGFNGLPLCVWEKHLAYRITR